MAGTLSPTDPVDAVLGTVLAAGREPRRAIASWAEGMARARGATLVGRGLRLFDGIEVSDPITVAGTAFDLGHLHERLMADDRRRSTGSHLTPSDVAAGVVGLLDTVWPTDAPRILDPAVGGGAFLIAAADRLRRDGTSPSDARDLLHGVDLDPLAIAVAEAAIAIWGIDAGLEPAPVLGLAVGDGLLDPLPRADVIVGNPPFLNQLRDASKNAAARREQLRERFGDLVGAYTDEGWLFMAAAVEALDDDGCLALIQPVSFLAARDSEHIRQRLHERSTPVGLWVGNGRVFTDASVEVCAPVLTRRSQARSVARFRGREFEQMAASPGRVGVNDWGRLGAAIVGVPPITGGMSTSSGTVGDLAHVTAGFRDQFYGFVPYVADRPSGQRPTPDQPGLVTVGMVDPFTLRRDGTTFRFAGESYANPVVDLQRLRAEDPKLADWADERLRPKVLVATQTRVIEAVVDIAGTLVPATPVISVEPRDPNDLWLLLAAISAPVVTADTAAATFGTALSSAALKLSARNVAAIPLPFVNEAWQKGARLAELLQTEEPSPDTPERFREYATAMGRSHAHDDTHLVQWWDARRPRR